MNDTERREQMEYETRRAARRAVRKRKQRREIWIKILALAVFFVILFLVGWQVFRFFKIIKTEPVLEKIPVPKKVVTEPPEYDVQLLSINEYSRPGNPLHQVTGVVVHYTANPGTTAQQNRDYFEGLSLSGETYASSHFVIGIEGELIQCIPCQEIAYASNDRNEDTIAIECCILDETGKFSDATYGTLVHLLAWLVGRYELDVDDVIRHYDITQKNCPKYYVENPDAWIRLKEDVRGYIERNGVVEEPHSGTEE